MDESSIVAWLEAGSFQMALPSSAPFLMGRATDCDLRLEEPEVSRHHARLYWLEDGLYVEDLMSMGGVFVNDVRVGPPQKLAAGDTIRIGPRIFRLRLGEVSAAPGSTASKTLTVTATYRPEDPRPARDDQAPRSWLCLTEQALDDIQAAASRPDDPAKLMSLTLRRIVEVIKPGTAVIELMQDDGSMNETARETTFGPYFASPRLNPGIVRRVIANRCFLFIPTPTMDPSRTLSVSTEAELCLPLMAGKAVIGVLGLQARTIEQDEIMFVARVADVLAPALDALKGSHRG